MHIIWHFNVHTFALLILFPSIRSLGINCRGSLACEDDSNYFFNSNFHVLSAFYNALVEPNSPYYPGGPINISTVYDNSRHIICSKNLYGFGGVCLFPQGNVPHQGIPAQLVLDRLWDLVEHDCTVCGSVPLSGDNDPDKMGILTSNYVAEGACLGVCRYS